VARIRSIKPEIRTSEKVNAWPVEIRYFWIMLWGYVDDYGKGRDNAKLIVADTYPLDDNVTPAMVEEWLCVLAHDDVIARYVVDGKRYLVVLNWAEHQRPSHPAKSVLPDMPDDYNGSATENLVPAQKSKPTPPHPSNGADYGSPREGLRRITVNDSPEQGAVSSEQGAVSGGSAGAPPRSSTAARSSTRIPRDFKATPPMIAWALENTPNVNWQNSTKRFKSYYNSVAGNSQLKTDWVEAWKSWLLGDQEKAAARPQQFKTAAEKNLEAGAALHAKYSAQLEIEGTQ